MMLFAIHHLNFIGAVVALPIMLLVVRGFLPQLIRDFPLIVVAIKTGWSLLCHSLVGRWLSTPSPATLDIPGLSRAFLVMSVEGASIKSICRMVHWDIYRPVTRMIDPDASSIRSLSGVLFNAALNFGSFGLGLCGLAALFFLIPAERRRGWSLLSAPFYPNGLRIWRWRKSR